MDPTALPLPSNLPSADSWRADLDTWHDKFVLVDPSGLLFFETQRREYAVSPVPWVRRSVRCNITSDNTAPSGRPSEAFGRKSCPFPNDVTSSTLVDVTKAEPSNSAQLDNYESSLHQEAFKSNKRRKLENSSVTSVAPPRKGLDAITASAPTFTTSTLTSVKKSVKERFNWRRFKKGASNSLNKKAEPGLSVQSSAQLPSSKVNRKRRSGTFGIVPVVSTEPVPSAELEALRSKCNLPPDAPLVCSVCSSPALIYENWTGYRFGKLACRPCGRFVENAFLYAPVKTVPVCATGLRNCPMHYTVEFPCRFCRLKKCLTVWPPESLPLQKFANPQARQIWLSRRQPLLDALSEPPVSEIKEKPLPVPASPSKAVHCGASKSAPVEADSRGNRKASRSARNSEPVVHVVKEEHVAGSSKTVSSSTEVPEVATRRSSRPGRGSKMTDIIESINAPLFKRRPNSRQQFSDEASVSSMSSSRDVTETSTTASDVKEPSNVPLTDLELGDFVIERSASPVIEQAESQQKDVAAKTIETDKQTTEPGKGRGSFRQKSKFSEPSILVPDDHVVDIVKPEKESPSKSKRASSSLIEASTSKTTDAEPVLWCAAPRPRAAALAASAAIRTQHAEHTRRTSLSPKKESARPSSATAPSPPKKQRRNVSSLQQQRISLASLKSVKPTKRMNSKEVASKKVTPPRRNSSEPRPSILDSPEYVPPITDELKASINRLKSDSNDKRPRIKHVFRQPSATFLPRNASAGNLVPSSPPQPPNQGQPPVAGKNAGPTQNPGNQYHSRSPTPPPPLTAPIRITVDKLVNKPVIHTHSGGAKSGGANENKKVSKKSVGGVISPTRSNQQLKPTRCNRCPGCRLADCGKCRYCLDMPKFGGSGQLHHVCEKRVCQFQDRLQEFTYRRIKLPTLQLPDVTAPVCAVKEATSGNIVAPAAEVPVKSPTETVGTTEKTPQILLTPPANILAEVTFSSGSPGGSTEIARRSSICSNGLACGSPIPNSVMQSPVQEEIVISSNAKLEEEKPPLPPVAEPQKDDEELVDVSSLKPILSEFELLPPLLACSEARRRRVCAAILEDVSLERALNEGVSIVTTTSLMPAIRALCLLCGSAGTETMLFCQLCAHPFHTFCLSLLDEDSKETLDLSEIDLSTWLCPSCQYCELCTQPSASNNRLARCTRCHYYFHPACLAPNYPVPKKRTKAIWVCSCCVKCEDCGATHPGRGVNAQWSSDFKFCQACNDARGRNFCPECMETYAADDYTLRMLQCNRCDAWVHATPCAGLTDDLYDLFEFLPDSVHFVCLKCAKKLSIPRPQVWEVRVQRLLADRLGEALAAFVQHIQGVAGEMTEETIQTEDTLQCQLAIAAMEAEEQKDVMQILCEQLVKQSYREISTFIFDFWNVLKVHDVTLTWLTDLLLSSFTGMNVIFKKRVRTETLAKIEEKKEASSVKAEKAKEKKAKKEAEKKKQQKEETKKPPASAHKENVTILQNVALINRSSEDARMCRLCCRFGDGDCQEAGRLLYAGQDDWVHVNCALWSAEVFERGSLLCNVTQALARSRHLKCIYCGRTGATLQCREQGCRMDFHFMCARENNHAFTEDHHCYCPKHTAEETSGSDSDEEGSEIAYISDFSVDRRLICDPDSIRWRRSWLDGFNSQDITIVVGSLTVLRLGTICELSDVKHVLIPLQYAIERVHWDAEEPTRLRVYRCIVDAVQSPHFENPNSEASTTVFKTPGKISDEKTEEKEVMMKTPEPQLSDPVVPVPPLPEPEPTPSPTPPVSRSLNFDDDVPSNRLPLVVWSGISANWNKQETSMPQPPQPAPPPSAKQAASPKMMTPSPSFSDPATLNRVRRLIDVSPSNEPATLMRSVQSAGANQSPKKSDSLSRLVPFAHLKPVPSSSSATLLRLASPPRQAIRPKIPPPEPVEEKLPIEQKEPEIARKTSCDIPKPPEPLVASEAVAPPQPKNGRKLFFPMPDSDVLHLVDHVVSRVAFANADFSRHGASLLQSYSSPHETTLHLLRNASGINGKQITTAAANDFYSTTMWTKYRIRTKNRNSLGPKPIIGGPSPNSGIVPIILNQSQAKMNAARPPEMELFPVSIFPAPRFGMRAKRHFDVMQEANEAILAEQRAEEAKKVPMVPAVIQPIAQPQAIVPSVVRPQVKVLNSTGGMVPVQFNGQVVRQIPIARLQLVTQPGPPGSGPRVFSIRAAPRPVIQSVQNVAQTVIVRQPQPRLQFTTVPMANKIVAQPPKFISTTSPLTSAVNKAPITNTGVNRAVLSVSGPTGPILHQPQPDMHIPVSKIVTNQHHQLVNLNHQQFLLHPRQLQNQYQPQIALPTPAPPKQLQVATPPFLNISLPPISPVSQPPSVNRPSILSPPSGIVPKFSISSSPAKVRFQDASFTTDGPLISPGKFQKLSSSVVQKPNPQVPQQNQPQWQPQPVQPSQVSLTHPNLPGGSGDTSLVKKSEKVSQKRKEQIRKRETLNDFSSNAAPKKAKAQPISDSKKQVVVAKRPRTPLSLATLLPKSPLKACLPTTELALAEIVNRVVTESVLFDGPDAKGKAIARQRKHQRYLVFEIMPSIQASQTTDNQDQTWKIRGFTWQDSWRVLFSRLTFARQNRGLTPLCYDSLSGLSLLGLTQSSVVALIEQLPGVEDESSAYAFRFARYERTAPNPAGCARAQPYCGNWHPSQRRHRDVFAFLLSGYRRPKIRSTEGDQESSSLTASTSGSSNGLVSWEVSRPHKTLRRPTALFDLPLPTRLRYLRETARYDVGVFRSTIHARGLYALRNFEAQEMIIEYAGELIRATLTDKRERMYERQGIGCYMFRLDDRTVIDATKCGNAGRFINHCCEPNCYSRVIVGYEGLKHIVIFALRPIAAGEELTYDYKFPLEDAASKIPCYCGARRCRKYLN